MTKLRIRDEDSELGRVSGVDLVEILERRGKGSEVEGVG